MKLKASLIKAALKIINDQPAIPKNLAIQKYELYYLTLTNGWSEKRME